VQRKLHVNLIRKTHETLGTAWCAAEARKLNDYYFPGVSARIPLCALAPFAHAHDLPRFVAPRSVSVDPAAPHARRRAISPKNDQVPVMRNERRRGQRPGHHDQVPARHLGRAQRMPPPRTEALAPRPSTS
jgi:hypothetical protein